jgi:hypothetical protein
VAEDFNLTASQYGYLHRSILVTFHLSFRS